MPDAGRREWIAGVAATLAACERTRSPIVERDRSTVTRGMTASRVGDLDQALGPPLQIVPARGGDAALVVHRGGVAITGDTGLRSRALGGIADRRGIATDAGWIVGAQRIDARGELGEPLVGAGVLDEPGARQLALHGDAESWITAAVVAGSDRPLATLVTRRSPAGGPRWTYEQPGRAAATTDDAGGLAIVGADGRLRVLGDPSDGAASPRVVVDVAVDPPAYAIAYDDRGVLLLVAPRDDASREGGDRIAAPPDWRPVHGWSTTLVGLARDGSERMRVALAFPGLSAPLRLPDGTVAVVGLGRAGIADGKVVWTRNSDARVHACVAGDDLVLGHGPMLERVNTAGEVKATATLATESVACAPVLGFDGTLWVATTRALWRVR